MHQGSCDKNRLPDITADMGAAQWSWRLAWEFRRALPGDCVEVMDAVAEIHSRHLSSALLCKKDEKSVHRRRVLKSSARPDHHALGHKMMRCDQYLHEHPPPGLQVCIPAHMLGKAHHLPLAERGAALIWLDAEARARVVAHSVMPRTKQFSRKTYSDRFGLP